MFSAMLTVLAVIGSCGPVPVRTFTEFDDCVEEMNTMSVDVGCYEEPEE